MPEAKMKQEQAKQEVKKLVERFRYNIDVYKKSAYNEAQVRREFIDPFFEALGWDVSNKQGYAEQYKEVVLEDTIKVGGSTRAPDYSFRIGGQRQFFVEAKKPAVNIKEDVSPSYQLSTIDFSNPDEKAQHDKLVALEDNMLELQKKYYETRMESDKEFYDRQIKIVDAQIDRRVYDLYGLMEEEIRVVERS
jgi:hypothetical protein